MKPTLNPVESFKNCLPKILDFNGRARRSEYWWYAGALTILDLVVSSLVLKSNPGLAMDPNESQLVSSLISIAFGLPALSVAIRRLHDIGKSGWYIFTSLIPLVGVFILIYYYCKDSDPNENEYGPSPKYAEDDWSDQNPSDNANIFNDASQSGAQF